MSVSERLAQEDRILREIRMTLSSYRSVSPLGETRRRGVVYASSPITSGLRLFNLMRREGVKSPDDLKQSPLFRKEVVDANISNGEKFGNELRRNGYPLVIVPGAFFAKGWTQGHYMSLWRQVIIRFSSKIAFNENWQWSSGCVEEFLISIENDKIMLNSDTKRIETPRLASEMIRGAIDQIDDWGFDAKPLYDIWRQIELALETKTKLRTGT